VDVRLACVEPLQLTEERTAGSFIFNFFIKRKRERENRSSLEGYTIDTLEDFSHRLALQFADVTCFIG